MKKDIYYIDFENKKIERRIFTEYENKELNTVFWIISYIEDNKKQQICIENLDELIEFDCYLDKKEAIKILQNSIISKNDFIQKCKEFNEICEQSGFVNPFFIKGYNSLVKQHRKLIESIEDKILKYYLESHLDTHCYNTEILDLITKEQ